MVTLSSAECVNGMQPKTPVRAPADSDFGTETYLAGEALEEIGNKLIRTAGAGLGDILEAEVPIRYLWRRKSARSRGKEIPAQIKRSGGLSGFLAKADYVLEVSAPYVRENRVTHWQLEAMIYAELCHIGIDVLEDGETRLSLRPHDLEMFSSEVSRYGLWRLELTNMAPVLAQAPLFDLAPETAETPKPQQRARNGPRTRESENGVSHDSDHAERLAAAGRIASAAGISD